MRTTALVGIAFLAVACSSDPNVNRDTAIGAGLGGLAGAVVGNNVSGGNTLGGAAIGALAGGAVGHAVGKSQQPQQTAPNTRQYYDAQSGRYYYYDPHTGHYYWENGEPRY